eukprot:CAMPEP_0119307860 /NCGR_PEP_ID=MMETSP1333-20130426/8239_1 /TAXON_ID=418940 /ORGANISM="Scyphosphaera apsteinii, Strain RCC1455" /LENGTH=129 /DNA_ID=CAMNT_0007311497 /DNA_START=15 /DNA_END=401 /DNA_ORIENTATION=+
MSTTFAISCKPNAFDATTIAVPPTNTAASRTIIAASTITSSINTAEVTSHTLTSKALPTTAVFSAFHIATPITLASSTHAAIVTILTFARAAHASTELTLNCLAAITVGSAEIALAWTATITTTRPDQP